MRTLSKRGFRASLAVALACFIAACSSGTTVSDAPISFSGVFAGTFENTPGTQSGTLTINMVESTDGTSVTGTVIFDSERANCLLNGTISSSSISGFSISIVVGDVTFQLSQSSDGNTLSGSYVSAGAACSNSTGSGSVTLTRQ